MNKKWLTVAGELLERASEEFSNHVCNDWDFPEDWTEQEKVEFVREMHRDNNSEKEFDPKHLDVPDWWVMAFLAKRLQNID